ncbi:MAG: divalent-cation tolerance protein CutA [Nitrospiria bacterium]
MNREKGKENKKVPGFSEVVILITAPSTEEAQKIAHSLVGEHLVACANLVSPVQSIFYWQEKVCDVKEVLVICKSRVALFEEILKRVKELHSYTVPEIIALPIIKGSEDYLRWINEVTGTK